MNETTPTYQLGSLPVHIAMGLRMLARHMGTTIDTNPDTTAHPDRLREVADEMETLVTDARRVIGADQHDRTIYNRIDLLRALADRRQSEMAA